MIHDLHRYVWESPLFTVFGSRRAPLSDNTTFPALPTLRQSFPATLHDLYRYVWEKYPFPCFWFRQGEPIAIYDGRPNTEMFLASGKLEENNLSDYLTVQASLVAADKLYVMKKQVQTLSTCACRCA